MPGPCFAVTGDDARFYVNPFDRTEFKKKSVTTVKKQGVPNSIIEMWRGKEVALCALDVLDVLVALRERESLVNN